MDKTAIIGSVAEEVKAKFLEEGSGHDWWHIERVWRMARRIGKAESADLFVVELAALLHDIADWKFHGGDETVGPRTAAEVMARHGVDDETIGHVCDIIAHLSFKGAGVPSTMETPEGKVAQDADRLDAIGALGVARTFTYGGYKGLLMHHPERPPVLHKTKEEYMQWKGTSFNHFHEKLVLLKDLMNTETARGIAEGRHAFMEAYMEQFLAEWAGER